MPSLHIYTHTPPLLFGISKCSCYVWFPVIKNADSAMISKQPSSGCPFDSKYFMWVWIPHWFDITHISLFPVLFCLPVLVCAAFKADFPPGSRGYLRLQTTHLHHINTPTPGVIYCSSFPESFPECPTHWFLILKKGVCNMYVGSTKSNVPGLIDADCELPKPNTLQNSWQGQIGCAFELYPVYKGISLCYPNR